MSFADILALDDAHLNRAVDTYCMHHQWEAFKDEPYAPTTIMYALDRLQHPQGKVYSSVPYLHYTASWELCMGLAWRYNMDILLSEPGKAWVQAPDVQGVRCPTEEETRRGICRLAVWIATKEERER